LHFFGSNKFDKVCDFLTSGRTNVPKPALFESPKERLVQTWNSSDLHFFACGLNVFPGALTQKDEVVFING
jgi:hypothetical protein